MIGFPRGPPLTLCPSLPRKWKRWVPGPWVGGGLAPPPFLPAPPLSPWATPSPSPLQGVGGDVTLPAEELSIESPSPASTPGSASSPCLREGRGQSCAHTGFPSPPQPNFNIPPDHPPCPIAPLNPTAPSDTLSSVACLIPVLVSPIPALVCPCPGLSLSLPVLVSPCLCPCPGLSLSVSVLVSPHLCPCLGLCLSLSWSLPDSVIGLGVQATGASGALGEPAGE